MKKNLRDLIRKLERLARDQKGKPEGDLAEDTIKKIKAKYKNLDDVSPTVQWLIKFQNDYEFILWQMACRANDIDMKGSKTKEGYETVNDGEEVNLIVAKNEWQFALKQFSEMAQQVLRGIINKLWPKICTTAENTHQESQYSDFAREAMNRTPALRKAIKGG